MNMPDVSLQLDRARYWSMQEQPFFGALAMRLDTVLDSSIQTAATDGRSLRINPQWAAKLTDEETRFVLLHEALHCGHFHMWRLPPTRKGNMAGDHEINLTLAGVKGIKMPAGGLCDRQYENLACEEILARLPDDDEDGSGQGQGGGAGAGAPDPCGAFTKPQDDAQGQSQAQQAAQSQQLRQEWEQAVIQAAQAAQALGRGDLPADMARELARLKTQPIDWRRELADFIRGGTATRADWTRSASRHAWQKVIYPRRRADGFATIVVVRDTSGSIGDALCAQFSAAVDDCAAESAAQIVVLDCDAQIQAEYRLETGESCPRRAKGGGGTDFRPPFLRAAKLADEGERIAGIVYLTDLCGTEPDACDYPVLWLSTTDQVGKIGRTVKITG